MDEVKFTHEESDYKIVKPNNKIRKESDAVYAKSYRKAIAEGFFLEAEVDNIIKDRGIKAYNEKERKEIDKEIKDFEIKFNSSSFSSFEEGMTAYNRILELRKGLDDLDRAKRELSTQSASIQAENERFSYFVTHCSFTVDNERVWDKVEDYKDDLSELSNKFATEMIHIIYDGTRELMAELEKIRPENVWYKDQEIKNLEIEDTESKPAKEHKSKNAKKEALDTTEL